MKRLKEMALGLVLLFLVVALAVGCGPGSKTTSKDETRKEAETKKAEKTEIVIPEADKDYVIKLGYYNCDHMTAAPVGKDAGIYEKHGLKVEVIGNAKVPEAMTAGQMDAGYIGTEGLIRSYIAGAPILVAANNHLGGAHYLVVSNNIKDAKELPGKKLALGTSPEKKNASWIQFAEELGIPKEGSAYEIFNMTDKDEYLALKTGQLDGYTACDPWASMAEYEKTGHILAVSRQLPSGEWGSCCVLSMNKGFYIDHPELAMKLIQAHVDSIKYIYTHPAKTAKIFVDNYGVPEEVAYMTIWRKTNKEGRTLTWEINRDNFERELDYSKEVGVLEQVVPVTDFVKTNLLKKADVDDFGNFIKDEVDPVFPAGMSYKKWKQKVEKVGK